MYKMADIIHVLKALALFCLGSAIKNVVLLGISSSIILDVVYYLALIWLIFWFALNYKPSPVPATDFNVCIIGAGFSGIGMAIKLKEIGVKFRLLEKGTAFGGTWWDNQYPGCACDVASHVYSFSFEMNPNWTRSFSSQPEILRYLENVAKKYNIDKHAEFGKKVVKTTWNNKSNKWSIETDSGETFTANVIVSGNGALHVPVIPEFKGRDSFKGEAFHSAQWKLGFDPTGKTVAVIGTGATAVQIVPSIASKVKHMKVFQRTPCWVPPKADFVHSPFRILLFRMYPFAMYLLRCFYFWRNEFRYFTLFRLEGILRKRVIQLLSQHVRTVVKDQEVAEKLIPSFEVGCKRITPSNTYLQSFNRKNVTLVTEEIDSINEDGIRTTDGNHHEFDTIIYATGFSVEKSAKAYETRGINGYKLTDKSSITTNGIQAKPENGVCSGSHMNGHTRTPMESRMSLAEEWDDQPNAYKGITYPGYPNLFFLLGPGTGLGHNTVVYMIECQIAYAIDAIRNMIETNVKSIDVKKEVNDQYQEWVQECMKNKVFNSPSCTGWYRNKRGINFTLWPSHLTHYWWVTRKCDLENYHCKF